MRKHADFGMVLNHNNECGVKQKMSKSEQRNVSRKSDVRVGSELDWNQIDWRQVQNTVTRLQARIVKAQQEGRYGKVKSLTRILTRSFAAKAMAVKKVTTNKGNHTPGVDGTVWRSAESKTQAILELQQDGYRAKPLRRKYIPKAGSNKMRPLGIPTMKDRAMQAIYAMALLPIAETTGDRNSYGFRPYRSCQDAIDQIRILMRPANRPQWVLEGDIKGCFDNISHDWILNNIPMEKRILRQWLKCGYMENDCKHFNEAGTPQGGIISPVIANMVLDGLETMLNIKYRRKCHNSKTGKVYWRSPAKDSKQIHFIRYADDFIITGNSKEVLENEVKPMVKTFLAERGLELSDEKTVITPVNEGFDFLGFNIRTFNEMLLVTPAGKRVKRLKSKINETITLMHGESALAVIEKLNPIIRGWTNYYRFVNSSQTFSDITRYTWEHIWEWAKRRHPRKSMGWIKQKYFTRIGNRDWRFFARREDGTMATLTEAMDYKIIRHIKIKSENNPFDQQDRDYFANRRLNGVIAKPKTLQNELDAEESVSY